MNPSSRLDLVDALRGFALVSIMLLHNIEHFDLYHLPAGLPAWLVVLDKLVWDTAFFLFGGKSYAIFAMLFGVTFWLQFKRRAEQGADFRPRFAWRMLLLFGFGLVNSLFYHGDILTLYAALALALLPVARLRDGTVLAIAVLLLLQPYAWWELLQAAPVSGDPASWAYFGRANEYLSHGSLWQVWSGNLLNGKPGVVLWSWENGRLFQIPALFMLGMLAARRQLFAPANRRLWWRVLAGALAAFLPLFLLKRGLPEWGLSLAVQRPLETMVASWSNLAFMLVLVAGFALCYRLRGGTRLLSAFTPLGRMSLSSYLLQSVVGTALYYGWGFGLYQYMGAAFCLLIGIGLAVLQGTFSAWWLRHHAKGPLESLWHRLTWLRMPRPVSPA
jgi:uncharacterized protein